MAVVGEFVQADVAHHHEVVAHLGPDVADGLVQDAVRVEGRRALGVALVSGMPNSMMPPTPSSTASARHA